MFIELSMWIVSEEISRPYSVWSGIEVSFIIYVRISFFDGL